MSSDRRIRCNSETFYSIDFDTKRRFDSDDIPVGVAVNASFRPDDITMIEPVRFSKGSDAMYLTSNVVPLTDRGSLPRQLRLLFNCLRHPIRTLKLLYPFGKTRHSVLLMIMQSADAFVHARWQPAWTRLFRRGMTLVQEPGDSRLTTYFPIGQAVARRYADKAGGAAGNVLLDILADVPVSGHVMGGVTIGAGAGQRRRGRRGPRVRLPEPAGPRRFDHPGQSCRQPKPDHPPRWPSTQCRTCRSAAREGRKGPAG